MIESITYADTEMEHFKRLDGLSEETLRIIRLELIAAYRAGYALAVEKMDEMK